MIQDRGPGGHDPEEDVGGCVEQRLKMVRIPPAGSQRQKADQISTLRPGYGEFRTDYEPILARIARLQAHTCPGGAGGGACAANVDHGNPAT